MGPSPQGGASPADSNANALFSFVHILEVFATLLLLVGHLGLRAKGSRIRRGLILALAATQASLSLLYFLDTFDISPQSTMAWGAQLPPADTENIGGKGNPLQLLVICEAVQFCAAVLAVLFYGWDTVTCSWQETAEEEESSVAEEEDES